MALDKNARIFIAGHRGLIGSACLRHFTAQGFGNVITKTRAELDLTDCAAVTQFFETARPQYVIMSAGKVGGIIDNKTFPADFMNQNLQLQVNVFAAAHAVSVRRLLFFGSSCMYPRECVQPMAEAALLTGKPEPTSLAYAMAKLAGLQLCHAYNTQFSKTAFIPVIPNSVYGANDNFDPATGHVLSTLIHRFQEAKSQNAPTITLWGTGTPRREFLFSDDLAAACHIILETEEPALPINIGVGSDVSIKELAEMIAKLVDYTGQINWDTSKPDGAPRKLLDSGRINAMGWQAKTSLEQGLLQTYNWYRQHKGLP